MEALVKGIIHLGDVIAGDYVVGIEDKVALKRVGILVENAIETKVHDPALALAGQVIALVNNGTGLARELRRIIGAGIGDHEDLDKLGRIILVLDGANEVGDHGLLVMRRDKEGITMQFLALGGATSPRRAPMTKKTTWYRKQTVSSVTTIWLKITMGVLVCKKASMQAPSNALRKQPYILPQAYRVQETT